MELLLHLGFGILAFNPFYLWDYPENKLALRSGTVALVKLPKVYKVFFKNAETVLGALGDLNPKVPASCDW